LSPPARKGRGEEAETDPAVFQCLRRRVGSRAASGGGECKDAPPLFRFAEGLPCNFWIFRECFFLIF
jgi:hypothetical protein